jgi:dihydropteroate synthase
LKTLSNAAAPVLDVNVSKAWHTTRFKIDLSKPKVMGIVNVTPDSFATHTMARNPSCMGSKQWIESSIDLAASQIKEGADIIDIGAESTRPGAATVSLEMEWERLQPVVKELLTWKVPISVDTYKPEIMKRVLDMGVDIINDIWALRQAQAVQVIASFDCGVCLMHMHAEPATMQVSPMQSDVMQGVKAFLDERVQVCLNSGVHPSRLILDPGIGFGKTVEQNFTLLKRQAELHLHDLPLLMGWSRKSSLGVVTGLDVDKRVTSSVVAAVLAFERGAQVVRVHDVASTMQGLQVWLHASGLQS